MKMVLKPNPRENLAERIYRQLKQDIFDFRLLPADRFSENEIAERMGVTEPQLCIRWSLQAGLITIPKSVKPERIAQNGDAADKFEISAADMAAIAGLDCGHKASGSVNDQDRAWDEVR